MHRFRDFFTGQGMNMDPEGVPFRHREEFAAPLVTLHGYTYGVRLVGSEAAEGKGVAVEVSANVYSDEFDLERLMRAATHFICSELKESFVLLRSLLCRKLQKLFTV